MSETVDVSRRMGRQALASFRLGTQRKFVEVRSSKRRAISPIIATVLIIAVTLIAAVAIGGFVFGIFGSSSSSAQVQVTSQNLIAADFTSGGSTTSFSCSVAAAAPNVVLTNTGTSATTVTGVTLTWAGAVNSFTPSNLCTVAAAGNTGATSNGNPLSMNFPNTSTLTVSATTGQTYTGTVTMGNGAVLLFTGSFN